MLAPLFTAGVSHGRARIYFNEQMLFEEEEGGGGGGGEEEEGRSNDCNW